MSYDIGIIGAGFVGSALAKHLSRHYDVVTFDVVPDPPLLKGVDVEHRTCDITQYSAIKAKLEKPRIVIHTAIIQIPAINEFSERAFEVNVLGTQNVCRFVKETPETLGLILTGTWHVFGEREYGGVIDVSFGYRPDKVEDRAKLYVISKMIQEGLSRFYDYIASEKAYNIMRLGTVLGEHMPEKAAANIFIANGLKGKPITPYLHSMYRPMLYVAIDDVCKDFHSRIKAIIGGEKGTEASERHIFNLFYPKPISILELAEIVKEAINFHTNGKINPEVKIIDKGLPILFSVGDKHSMHTDIGDIKIEELKSPKEAIFEIVNRRCKARR